MTEKTFQLEMRRAKMMIPLEPDRIHWWTGYQRGLRRAYHGEKFGTVAEHKKWWSLADETGDEWRVQRGLGYRAALEFAKMSGKPGRPLVSDSPTVVISARVPAPVAAQIPDPKGDWIRTALVDKARKEYCTQNDGDCESCSLVNYRRDCKNIPLD